MNQNLIPSLIIAGAIVATGLLFRQTVATSAGTQIEAVISSLENASQKKDAAGKTRVSKIIEGVSSSVADGFKAGFSSDENGKTKEQLAVRDKLEVREVKISNGRMKMQENIIGLIKNNSDAIVSNIQLNVVSRDKDGKLLDVTSNFARVQGTLKPGQELGFSVERTLGDFNEKAEELAGRKATTATVSVVELTVVK